MEEPFSNSVPATTYERLRRRSAIIAQLWALSECCRIVFASATFLVPFFVLVFIVFERDGVRGLTEWQLYLGLVVMTAGLMMLWGLAGRTAERLSRGSPRDPTATAGDP